MTTHSKARIGILANEGGDCHSCNSRIGFGTGGKHDALSNVETSLKMMQIMVINSLKLWGTFWYSERHPAKNYLIIHYILRPIWALLVHYYTGLTLLCKNMVPCILQPDWTKKKKTFRQIGFLRVKHTFSAKNMSKEANIKTKQCTLCFSFSSLPFFLFALSFSCFLFLRLCDFLVHRAQKAVYLRYFT